MWLKKEALYFLAVIGYRKYNLTGKISSAYTVCQRVFNENLQKCFEALPQCFPERNW